MPKTKTEKPVQRIAYPDNPIMAIMWRDCLLWAIDSPAIRQRFKSDTGLDFVQRRESVIDRMIDEACGVNAVIVDKFVDWFNANIWGLDAFAGECEKAE